MRASRASRTHAMQGADDNNDDVRKMVKAAVQAWDPLNMPGEGTQVHFETAAKGARRETARKGRKSASGARTGQFREKCQTAFHLVEDRSPDGRSAVPRPLSLRGHCEFLHHPGFLITSQSTSTTIMLLDVLVLDL